MTCNDQNTKHINKNVKKQKESTYIMICTVFIKSVTNCLFIICFLFSVRISRIMFSQFLIKLQVEIKKYY